MWDDDFEESDSRISFRFYNRYNGNEHSVNIDMRNGVEFYPNVLAEFTTFLKAMGFDYIDTIVAFDQDGNELKSSRHAD